MRTAVALLLAFILVASTALLQEFFSLLESTARKEFLPLAIGAKTFNKPAQSHLDQGHHAK